MAGFALFFLSVSLTTFFLDGLDLVGSGRVEEVEVGFQIGGFSRRREKFEDLETLALWIAVPLTVLGENVFAIVVDDD